MSYDCAIFFDLKGCNMKNLILTATLFAFSLTTSFSSGLVFEPAKVDKLDAMVKDYIGSMFSKDITSVDNLSILDIKGDSILSINNLNITNLSLVFLPKGNYKIKVKVGQQLEDFVILKK